MKLDKPTVSSLSKTFSAKQSVESLSGLGAALYLIDKQSLCLHYVLIASSWEGDSEGKGAGRVELHLWCALKLGLLLELTQQCLNLVAAYDCGEGCL